MRRSVKIVKKAIKGDAEAFERLLIEEERMLYYKALSYVGNKNDALDVIQETVYKAFLAIHHLKKPQYFSTWLVKILIRECYKLLKERNRMIPYEEDKLFSKLGYKEQGEMDYLYINDAVSQLEQNYQTAIILFYYHDLQIKDIAELMERPVGTVKTYLHRGRKSLKVQLERSYELHEKLL